MKVKVPASGEPLRSGAVEASSPPPLVLPLPEHAERRNGSGKKVQVKKAFIAGMLPYRPDRRTRRPPR
jgi:hypothetical protein